MRLRLKILSGFLILALMLSIAGIWSIYELKSMSSTVEEILRDNYKSINAAKTMIESLEREDSAILLLLLGNRHEGRRILIAADSLFEEAFNIAANNVTITGEDALIDDIKDKYTFYKNIWKMPIVDTHEQYNLNWYYEHTHPYFLDLKSSITALMTMNDRFMYDTASSLKEQANRAVMPGIVAIVSALLFTLLFNYFVNFYFISPIIKINKGIKDSLANRAKFDVEIDTHDEITELAESVKILFNSMKS